MPCCFVGGLDDAFVPAIDRDLGSGCLGEGAGSDGDDSVSHASRGDLCFHQIPLFILLDRKSVAFG